MSVSSGRNGVRAAGAGNRWFARLHVVIVLMLFFGGLGIAGALLSNVVLGLQGGKHADYGFRGLWLTHAEIGVGKALTSGTQAVDTMVEVSAYNPDKGPVIAVLFLFTWLPMALTVFLALFWLSRIVLPAGFADHALFSMKTVRHLRRIGKALVLGSLVAFALEFGAKTVAAHMLIQDGYAIPGPITWPFTAVLAGIGAYVVAEVIRRGLVLLDELRGTI